MSAAATGMPGRGRGPPAAAVKVLLARWEARVWLNAELEAHARPHLVAAGLGPGEVEDFIEQQILTEQTEYLAEFFFMLTAAECQQPQNMAAFIDRHNAMVEALVADLGRGEDRPIGPRYKQRLWRLRSAHFSERVKAVSLARLAGERLVLSLKDLERFMALHMDPTLCRDRLDALVKARLLADEVGPNLRLFWSLGRLEALIGDALLRFLDLIEPLPTRAP